MVDDSAHYSSLDETYQFKSFHVGGKKAADALSKYFGKLWSQSEPYKCVPTKTIVEPSVIKLNDSRWREMICDFTKNPAGMRSLSSREFEEFIAQLLICDGYEVELTGRGKDGGRDVLAFAHGNTGRSLTIVECKRYAPKRKVDVAIVRALYGVLEAGRATRGIIATTSTFTLPAYRFQRSINNRIVLRGYGEIAKWVRRINEIIS